MTVPTVVSTEWENAGLSSSVLQVISQKLRFSSMTEVQSQTIPLLLQNKDVVVQSFTGSGKTLCFVIPIIERILRRISERPLSLRDLFALILSPTRELAVQIYDVVCMFFASCLQGSNPLLLIGGNSIEDDYIKFEKIGCNVVVGTPGRIEEFFREFSQNIAFSFLDVLILDEGDRLLELGFQPQITSILERLPKQRRTGLFSATQNEGVEKIIEAVTRNPVSINVSPVGKKVEGRLPTGLTNTFAIVEYTKKLSHLVDFLNTHNGKCIVYFLTCACVEYFYHLFREARFLTKTLVFVHGKAAMKVRTKSMNAFSSNKNCVLFCTDLVARGLDIKNVDWIIQYDAPQDPKQYVHRVGRTARMGEKGNAIILLYEHEEAYAEFLRGRQVSIQQTSLGEPKDILSTVTSINLKDRTFFNRSQIAFVSYIRGYKEHQCKFIFQLQKLNLGQLATGFGLVSLPQMPELSRKKLDFKVLCANTESIPYCNQIQEQARLARREKERKAKKEKRAQTKAKAKLSRKRHRNNDKITQEDLDDLAKEERLYKKLRKKKISEQSFDAAVGNFID